MPVQTRNEDPDFLEYCYYRLWLARGASEEHARSVAWGVSYGDRSGKLNQGMGVYEVLMLTLDLGALDITSDPVVEREGPAWAVVDGKRSSGYYTLTKMAELAIAKAKQHSISIVFGHNHNDGGNFGAYTQFAHDNDMFAMASNNTVPLAAPFGGMENILSAPPFDAVFPSGEEVPLTTSVKFAEFYDGDISEAVLQDKRMDGKWLIDPESGELTDDPRDYYQPISDEYGRVCGYSCGGQIEHPRTYALNLWNEGMTAVINPGGIISSDLPQPNDYVDGQTQPSVGGSYFLCIDPAHFGSIEDVKKRSDRLVRAVRSATPRPGHTVRLPGEQRYRSNPKEVRVLTNHWEPFFAGAAKFGLTEESLRSDFASRES